MPTGGTQLPCRAALGRCELELCAVSAVTDEALIPPLGSTQKWSLCVYVAVLFCLAKTSFFFTFYFSTFCEKDSELDFVKLTRFC